MAAVAMRQSASASRDRMSMRRIIIKQSYLKKLANAARVGASLKSPHRRWFVFGVMNGADPYIEYYESEDAVFRGAPINMFFLDSCKKVLKKRTSGRHNNVFTIILRDRELTLVAESRSLMEEWCTAISQKLLSLGIFVEDDDDHIYVITPVSRPLSREGRERHYPSRPARILTSDRSHAQQVDQSQSNGTDANQNGDPDNQEMYEETRSPTRPENSYAVPQAEREGLNPIVQQNGSNPINLDAPRTPPPAPHSSEHWILFGDTPVQPVTVGDSGPQLPAYSDVPTTPTSPLPRVPSTPNSGYPSSPMSPLPPTPTSPDYFNFPSLRPLSGDLSPPIVSDMDFSILTPKMQEALGDNPAPSDQVVGWNMPPPDADAPPLYVPQGALEKGANCALKHSQVDALQREMLNPGGVQVLLKKIDCLYAIAFVDILDGVWIAGWNQRARPHLHSAFHIGDRLISINGQVIQNSKMAVKLLKHCGDEDKITFIIRRVPHGRVLAMKRSMDAESLGIQRNGGTAEIVTVDELGLASQAGLSMRAVSLSGSDFSNWWITEINSRPLNLFFKEDEIEKRLNAVGLDISFLVQPMDFIQELKRKLKVYKNYKDFLLM